MATETKSIRDIIDNEYREYSMYVLEHRAIPSAIDGLKTVQRKLLYMANKIAKNKEVKVSELGSSIASCNYLHGEASSQAACVGMAQDWCNNAPLLKGHGNFGSRLVPEAAAPRYIYASLSDNFGKWFTDFEVMDTQPDPEDPEPFSYLPIVPWVLVNGIKGIAVGFACEILPRSPEALRKACLDYMTTGKIDRRRNPLKPEFADFTGSVTRDSGNPNKWTVAGTVTKKNTTTYEITELPIGMDRDKYMKFLIKLEDDGTIVSFDDRCDKSGFRFTVKVKRSVGAEIDNDPVGFFKLEKSFTENLTTLDEKGKLKVFGDVVELIQWFCDYRVTKCAEKVAFEIDRLTHEIDMLNHKERFIQDVIAGRLDIKNSTKQQMLDYIYNNITKEDYGKTFVNIPIYDFTKDHITALNMKIGEKTGDRVSWKRKTGKSYYLELLS